MKTDNSGRAVCCRKDARDDSQWWASCDGRFSETRARNEACTAYQRGRENGWQSDNPQRVFPRDGLYSDWTEDGHYFIIYTQGPKDKAWMEEKDKNYLARLMLGYNRKIQEAENRVFSELISEMANNIINRINLSERKQQHQAVCEQIREAARQEEEALVALLLPLVPLERRLPELFEALRTNRSVTTVNLSGIGITDEHTALLLAAIKENPRITEVDLFGNNISRRYTAQISAILRRRRGEMVKYAKEEMRASIPTDHAASNAALANVNIPDEYRCPISHLIMLDPVSAADEETYEREEIEKWLVTHDTSPLHHTVLGHKDLTQNRSVKRIIDQFLEAHLVLKTSDELYFSSRLVDNVLAAIKVDDVKQLRRLLDQDRRLLTATLKDNQTLLHLSCQQSPAILEATLKALGERFWELVGDDGGEGFFHLASEHLGAEGARLIVQVLGWDQKDIQVQLLNAIQRGHGDLTSVCLDLGGEVERADAESRTPLHQAVLQQQLELVGMLLERGSTIDAEDKDGNTALHLAAQTGQDEIAMLLMERGANAKAENKKGQRPVVVARESGHATTARLIEQKRQELKLAPHLRPIQQQIEILQRMVLLNAAALGLLPQEDEEEEERAEFTEEQQQLQDELVQACERGELERVRELIEQQGADPKRESNDGKLPLGSAIFGLNMGLVTYLYGKLRHNPNCLQMGIDKNVGAYGSKTPDYKRLEELTYGDLGTYFKRGDPLFSEWVRGTVRKSRNCSISKVYDNGEGMSFLVDERGGQQNHYTAEVVVSNAQSGSKVERYRTCIDQYKLCLQSKQAMDNFVQHRLAEKPQQAQKKTKFQQQQMTQLLQQLMALQLSMPRYSESGTSITSGLEAKGKAAGLRSQFFSGKGKEHEMDRPWYTDDNMHRLLRHYVGHFPKVRILDAIDAYHLDGETLVENIYAQQLQQTLDESLGASAIDTMVIPINLGNLHWAALYIHYHGEDRTSHRIGYIDPFGNSMPNQVTKALKAVYPNVQIDDILVSPIKLQDDGYNCGPWVVAILESLIASRGGRLPPEGFDIDARRADDQVILVQQANMNIGKLNQL